MHKDISVAVPTRHRTSILNQFYDSFYSTIGKNKIPHLTIIHDAPECYEQIGVWNNLVQEITLYQKTGLTTLYNMGIVLSPTDWVLLCNDDITFNNGWIEYLEEKIEENKHLAICLFSFGAVLLHKSIILKVGWWDERFCFGGYEDVDYNFRIEEAGLKNKVDRSHDFIEKVDNIEIGHFVNHHKYEYSNEESWRGDNSIWMKEKWDVNLMNLGAGYHRKEDEIDWYPKYTKIYQDKFNIPCGWK